MTVLAAIYGRYCTLTHEDKASSNRRFRLENTFSCVTSVIDPGRAKAACLQLETVQEQLALARNALAALMGQGSYATAAGDFSQANSLLRHVLRGLYAIKNVANNTSAPANLLSRRADIAATGWHVESTKQP